MTDKTPDVQDWQGYKDDIDSRYAFEIFFGKTLAELQPRTNGVKSNVMTRLPS